jgi:diacylglycerol kinase (ATP)
LEARVVDGTMRRVNIRIIVNPTAGSGRALRAGRALQERLDGAELIETQDQGHAETLARQAQSSGVHTVVAVGGDGTIHECATGLSLDEDGRPQMSNTTLAVLPAGTGGDYRKTFSWSDSVDETATRILSPNVLKVDVARLQYQGKSGPEITAVANVMTFGLGGLTDRIVENGPKWLGGRVAFLLGALRANAIFQTIPIELKIDGKIVETAPFSNVAICLGRYCGGGMKMAPDADPSDGLFDVVTMEMGKLKTTTLTTSIYRGTHLTRAGVRHYRGRVIEARPTREGESLIDVDGEQLGTLPFRVELLPQHLSLAT